MECPDFLPAELSYCQSFTDEKELIAALTAKPEDLVDFFETACADEPWYESHRPLMRSLLRWSAKAFYSAQLSRYFPERLTQIIQSHYKLVEADLYFRPALFFTVTFYVEKQPFIANSLLFGASSPFFSNLIRSQCYDKWSDEWSLGQVKLSIFLLVQKHILYGSIDDLWRYEEGEILELMQQAQLWNLPKLIKECSELLRRYLTAENVIETLLKAHRESFAAWKEECQNFLNAGNRGIRCVPGQPEDLRIELLDFKQETLELFDRLAPWITHLALSGKLSESPEYGIIINKCPKLVGIDLTGSFSYADQFDELPITLLDLNLSFCTWLRPAHLIEASRQFPSLKELHLAGNRHLDFNSWSELGRFSDLKFLDVSKCPQMSDEDLKLISQKCPSTLEINLEENSSLTDKGIADLLQNCTHLISIVLNNCREITDHTLYELGVRAFQLNHLSLCECLSLTDAGLWRLIRYRPSLRYLNIKNCNFSLKIIEQIKRNYPFLEIFY